MESTSRKKKVALTITFFKFNLRIVIKLLMKYHKLLLSELKEYYFKLVKQHEFLNEIEVQTLRIKVPNHSKPFPAKRFHKV
jgi:hypothetical protein